MKCAQCGNKATGYCLLLHDFCSEKCADKFARNGSNRAFSNEQLAFIKRMEEEAPEEL